MSNKSQKEKPIFANKIKAIMQENKLKRKLQYKTKVKLLDEYQKTVLKHSLI